MGVDVGFHPSVFRLRRNLAPLVGEAFFGQTHRFVPTDSELISACYGRGGYCLPDLGLTGFAPHPSPSVTPSPKGRLFYLQGRILYDRFQQNRVTVPHPTSSGAPFRQGSLTPFTARASPRPTLNYGCCGYYPTLNFALCILNYEFIFRLRRNPALLVGEAFLFAGADIIRPLILHYAF